MIERIIIENYKSIRMLDLSLGPINLLIGANGAGKSNFISFFQLVNRIYTGAIREYSLKKGSNNLLYRGLKNSEYIKGLLDFENKYAYDFTLVPLNDESLFLGKHRYYHNTQNQKTKNYKLWHYGSYTSTQPNPDTPTVQAILEYLNNFKLYHFHDTSDTSSMKLSHPIDDNQYLREDAGNLAAFLYFLQETHPKHFHRIEMTIRSIASFFDRFDLKPRSLNTAQIKLEWKEQGSDMYLDAYNLSDGTLRFMALTALLMQPEPPKTIIIDEPELGLHPVAINKLAGLIKKAAVHSQVIISTQSVGLVNNFEPEEIITVDRKDGESVFERLDNQSLQNWLEDFSLGELWNKNVIGGQP
ncbi:MAG: AAA family ATPase [Saprospiraceae bacterium]